MSLFVYVLSGVNYKLLCLLLLPKLCKVVYQEASSETAETEVQIETRDGKTDTAAKSYGVMNSEEKDQTEKKGNSG